MEQFFDVLYACRLFRGLEDQDLGGILSCLSARTQSYTKGRTVLAEGDAVNELGIVLAGSVHLVRVDVYGNRTILSTVATGGVFGEAFYFAGVEESPINVIADEDCTVMFIESARILHPCCKVCTFHTQMIRNLVQDLARKNLDFHQKIEVTSHRTTRDKLMAYLNLQAKKNRSARFTIPFDRQELADYLEVDRSGLSVEIGKLKQEGVIDCYKNDFRLLKGV